MPTIESVSHETRIFKPSPEFVAQANWNDPAIYEEASRDPEGFWSLVQENQDDLKWCGSSPFYTFLKAVPNLRGSKRRYQQWNIDEQSVVSFAGMSFNKEF